MPENVALLQSPGEISGLGSLARGSTFYEVISFVTQLTTRLSDGQRET